MDRKFAASIWIWSDGVSSIKNENIELFQKISDLGFEGVEIPTSDGHLNAGEIRDSLATSNKAGKLSPIVIGWGSPERDLASDSDKAKQEGALYIRRLIDLGAAIDADIIAGPLYAAVGEKKLLSRNERIKCLKLIAEQFRELGAYARENSVRLALEPVCRYDSHLINTTEQGLELVGMIDQDNVGLCLDTFHLNIEEKSVHDSIKQSSKHLFYFQACENDRGAPGSGHIRWGAVKEALDDLNYRGWISLESFVPDRDPFSKMMNAWRHLEPTQDDIAVKGLDYLRAALT